MVRAIRRRRFARYAGFPIYGVAPVDVATRQAGTSSRGVQSDEVDRGDADAAVASR